MSLKHCIHKIVSTILAIFLVLGLAWGVSYFTTDDSEIGNPKAIDEAINLNQPNEITYTYNNEEKSYDYTSELQEGAKLIHVQYEFDTTADPMIVENIYQNPDGTYDIVFDGTNIFIRNAGYENEGFYVLSIVKNISISNKKTIHNNTDLEGAATHWSNDGTYWDYSTVKDATPILTYIEAIER